MTNGLALLTNWSVRQKLKRVSSVQFSYVALFAPLLVKSERNYKRVESTLDFS